MGNLMKQAQQMQERMQKMQEEIANMEVTDKVTVVTRAAGTDSADGTLWESAGEGDYTIEGIDKASRGTSITLHLREDDKEYLDEWRLRDVIGKYSDHIGIPVEMWTKERDEEGNEKEEERLANNDAEKYQSFWKEFGLVLKEGPAEDFSNREKIAGLLRFASTHTDSSEQTVSLADYVSRMKEDQDKIYFLTADSYQAAKNSPHLEQFKAKGIEVILMYDRIDEWLMSYLPEFDGKQFQAITKADVDLSKFDDDADKEKPKVSDEFVEKYGLSKGHSLVIDDKRAEALYQELKDNNMITHEFAGGTIGNTLHNYSTLADDKSILLGVMSRDITIGSYSYRYLCNTSSRMDLNYLQAVQGPIGRCYALISEEGERTFAISEGLMNQLAPESIPEHIFKNASALVLTAYLVRCKEGDPMPEATMKAIEYAKKYDVPVVMTMGTKYVIQNNPQWWREFLAEHVSVVAMNEEEAEALTGEADPLVAADKTLEWVDMVLCTAGPIGLYMAGYTDDDAKRETSLPLLPGAIAEFNRYEFSRPMMKDQCTNPTHCHIDELFIKEWHSAFYAPCCERFVCTCTVKHVQREQFTNGFFMELFRVWCFVEVEVTTKDFIGTFTRQYHFDAHRFDFTP
eukprot:snap_masked-scaffold709_size108516-processed-gene-0.3 protein:Tk00880 transcript:snap_masked-scaffold709_size108516-processed-gene-0.3-mRNA-1 annotation:"inosine guanosine kinase"